MFEEFYKNLFKRKQNKEKEEIVNYETNLEEESEQTQNDSSKYNNKIAVVELTHYRDYNTIVNLSDEPYRIKINETDKIIDVEAEEWSYYDDIDGDVYKSELYLEILDINNEKRKELFAVCELAKELPFINNKEATQEEREEFFEYHANKKNFNQLTIKSILTKQQAIDMFEILIAKRDKIGFNFCDEGILFRSILKTSGLFYSKDARLKVLFNEYLGLYDYSPTIENLYKDALYKEKSPVYQAQKKKNQEGKIIEMPKVFRNNEQEEEILSIENDDEDVEDVGKVVNMSDFKRKGR